MPRELRRLKIGTGLADESEIMGMSSIFGHAFPHETPKLADVLYAGKNPYYAFTDFVKKNLYSEHIEFTIAFDTREEFDEDMCYGWISIGTVPHASRLGSHAAGDFSVNISLKMLATESRNRGEDPLQLDANNPRVRLANVIGNQSRDGQNRFVLCPHLVVNNLVMWPDLNTDLKREIASKLLGWAIEYAERHQWQIWAQVPMGQILFFSQAGFTEVRRFALNLNHYASLSGTDFGTQEWVQMVY